MRPSPRSRCLGRFLAAAGLAVTIAAFPAGAAAQLGLPGLPPPLGPAPDPPPPSATSTMPTPTVAVSPMPSDPSTERCFGAAAADRLHPCTNPDLRLTVVPAPETAAEAQHNRGCDLVEQTADLRVCYWGTPAPRATRLVGLIGDSHASHWRAALETVMAKKGWRAFTIQRAGCPLTLAHPNLPGAARQVQCIRWNRAVQTWVAAHPGIDTVFTSSHRATVIPGPGMLPGAARRAGYAGALAALLHSGVRHIIALRDTPRITGSTIPCIESAVAAGLAPGPMCALSRQYALRPDPVVQAAQGLHDARVQVADLASFLCGTSTSSCSPVIGGALVLRDVSHMTTTYSTTLGPYLLWTVDRLSVAWSAARALATGPDAPAD